MTRCRKTSGHAKSGQASYYRKQKALSAYRQKLIEDAVRAYREGQTFEERWAKWDPLRDSLLGKDGKIVGRIWRSTK